MCLRRGNGGGGEGKETAERIAQSAEHKKTQGAGGNRRAHSAKRIAQKRRKAHSPPTAVCAPLDLTQEALLESVQEQPLG